jgi:hypothetical protein
MRPRRCQLPPGTGPSLTRRDLVDRAALEARVDLDPVVPGLAVLDLVDRDRADLDPAVLDPVGLVARVGLDPVGRVDRAVLDPVDLAGPAHTRDPVDLVARVGLDPVGRVDLAVLDPVDLAVLDPVDLAGPADRVDPEGLAGPADLVDRADLVIRAARHRRRTRPEVFSTAVARRWAARGMCRMASAHQVTVRRLRPQPADGVGMAGLHPERRRLGGRDRRPRVAGTAHRLQVVGMSDGMGRTATKAGRSVISGRSTTTGTARFRCSIRCSGDGASGSLGSGFRFTDATQTSRPSDLADAGPKAVKCLCGPRLS